MNEKEFDELLSFPMPDGNYAVVVGTIDDIIEQSRIDDENAAQQNVQLTALRRVLVLSACIHIASGILWLLSAFGGN